MNGGGSSRQFITPDAKGAGPDCVLFNPQEEPMHPYHHVSSHFQHPYYETPRQRDARISREEVARLCQSECGTHRKGVRVLPDGTVEAYLMGV